MTIDQKRPKQISGATFFVAASSSAMHSSLGENSIPVINIMVGYF